VVFRLDPDLSLHRMIEGVSIPNGISWTEDNKTMYFADSPTKSVFKYDYDLETGSISNRRVFFHVEDEDGVPDGHVPDEEGCIWQAIHGLGKVIRISPQGEAIAEVKLPTRCVTCPGFVGEDLFVTSAEEEDPDRFPDSTKYQGSIFRIHVGVKGRSPHKFKLRV
jgi:sugar lactone lactonase YvrE